jgi:selenide,water dikinase
MQPGDLLILTKSIGTGTLFAAGMRMKAKGRWSDAALTSMVQSNYAAARCLHDHGATACTDVTGFGLLGHLVEMTRPSGVDVELLLGAIPFLDGALDTVRLGILSSLQPQNVRLRRAIRDLAAFAQDERRPLIFDPQTAGGLLASIPAHRTDPCLAELKRLGYGNAAIINTIRPQSDQLEPVLLRR